MMAEMLSLPLCAMAILAVEACGTAPLTGGRSATLREGLIPVRGGRVWYRIMGAQSQGIPLLVLHGGPGAPHDYLAPFHGFG